MQILIVYPRQLKSGALSIQTSETDPPHTPQPIHLLPNPTTKLMAAAMRYEKWELAISPVVNVDFVSIVPNERQLVIHSRIIVNTEG